VPIRFLIGAVYLFFFSACATSSIRLANEEKEWSLAKPDPSSKIYYSAYLIGDVGGAPLGSSTIPLLKLKEQWPTDLRDDQNTAIIFLGDNIYPSGMPPEEHKDRALAEHKLNAQLASVDGFKGNITFIPGNHDWDKFGRLGLLRQETYIEEKLSNGNSATDQFRPSNGCGDIEVMDLSHDIKMVTIDSHWFLTNKPRSGDYSNCQVKDRLSFYEAFKETMRGLKGKKVILTMHHPLYTVGAHGGHYSTQSHFFPLAELNSNLKIPIPFIGTILNYLKPRMSSQDAKSRPYQLFRLVTTPSIEEHGNTIVVAGHEHSLQYNLVNGVSYIVSGSGSKVEPVGEEDFNRFAFGSYGFGIIDYYVNDQIWLTFYATQKNTDSFEVVYRKQMN